MYKIRAEERVLIEEVDMNPEKMGKFILECRKEKHMTQLQLAEMINVTDKAVSRWERGIGYPDLNLMEPLANALNISMLKLIRAEKMKNENDSIADEIIKESLAICVEKIKQAKKCAGIGLLASYVTLGVGTIFACYYIADYRARGLMIVLLIISGIISGRIWRILIKND